MTRILAFLEAGYVDHLLLSSDTRKDFKRVARFAAQLRSAGVNDDTLHQILADNPRRFLASYRRKLSNTIDRCRRSPFSR